VPQNRRGRSRVPSDVKILIAGSNNLLLPEQKYVQVSNPLLWPKPPGIWSYGIAVLSVTSALIISRWAYFI
jgi:hypothetical protein